MDYERKIAPLTPIGWRWMVIWILGHVFVGALMGGLGWYVTQQVYIHDAIPLYVLSLTAIAMPVSMFMMQAGLLPKPIRASWKEWIGFGVVALMARLAINFMLTFLPPAWFPLAVIIMDVVGAILFVGFAQWVVLSRYVRQAVLWFLISGVGALLGLGFSAAATVTLSNLNVQGMTYFGLSTFVLNTIRFTSMGVITAVGLWYLVSTTIYLDEAELAADTELDEGE